VRVFDQAGNLLKEFLAFGSTFKGGVDVAVGDVNGDGKNDIAAAMSYNGSQVKIFKNTSSGSIPFTPLTFSTLSSFYPFGSGFKGGAVVELADMGTPVTISGKKQLNTTLDGKAEIIVGNEAGMRSTVKVFACPTATAATLVRTFLPFSSTFRGGLSLDVARVNDADLVPDIIVGAGNGGNSRVEIWSGANPNVLIKGFNAFTAADTPSFNAPLRVAALDGDSDGIAESILAAQGSDGTAAEIRRFDALTGQLVDAIFESDFDSIFAGNAIDDFCGAYFVSALKNRQSSLT
jgi:serralysin